MGSSRFYGVSSFFPATNSGVSHILFHLQPILRQSVQVIDGLVTRNAK